MVAIGSEEIHWSVYRLSDRLSYADGLDSTRANTHTFKPLVLVIILTYTHTHTHTISTLAHTLPPPPHHLTGELYIWH